MKNRMKRLLVLLLIAVMAGGCAHPASNTDEQSLNRISGWLGLDVSAAQTAAYTDSHGGFHGDGMTFAELRFPDGAFGEALAADALWQPLPLSENVTRLVYGIHGEGYQYGPYFTADGSGEPLIPLVEEGCWFFLDARAEEAPHDSSGIFDRPSLNVIVAIYDIRTRTLYFFKLDT